jgi:hypothetical protein
MLTITWRGSHQVGHRALVAVFVASVLALGVIVGIAPVRSVGAPCAPTLTLAKAADNLVITAGQSIGFTITIATSAISPPQALI